LLKSIPTADGIKVLQEALGHADISTTLNTYSHTDPAVVAAHIEAQAQLRLKRKMQRAGGKKRHLRNHLSKTKKAS
jgi:site-specific recombinase XerC